MLQPPCGLDLVPKQAACSIRIIIGQEATLSEGSAGPGWRPAAAGVSHPPGCSINGAACLQSVALSSLSEAFPDCRGRRSVPRRGPLLLYRKPHCPKDRQARAAGRPQRKNSRPAAADVSRLTAAGGPRPSLYGRFTGRKKPKKREHPPADSPGSRGPPMLSFFAFPQS